MAPQPGSCSPGTAWLDLAVERVGEGAQPVPGLALLGCRSHRALQFCQPSCWLRSGRDGARPHSGTAPSSLSISHIDRGLLPHHGRTPLGG